ncbi:YdcF family protein [Legionella hackeliae]|uniref:YdcF family protein n=1 Tax=Legionella hackeliae TaxID=449 RepID=UPI0011C080BC|nr:YdcF family protein [Legionella hackeliae]
MFGPDSPSGMSQKNTASTQLFFGMEFKEVFSEENIFTDDLKKSALTQNPTPIPEIDLVYVLAARTTVLSRIADIELVQMSKRNEDEFDLVDDIHRMKLGIELAIQVCALRAGKNPEELTEKDYVIPIFYNGRAIHNEDLKRALRDPELQKQLGKEPLPYYPARLFTISALYNPRKKAQGQNTIAQAQSFRDYLEHHHHEHVAIVSSAFHLPRVARTLGLDSPQMDEVFMEPDRGFRFPDSIGHVKLYLYGVHKNEARKGIKLDLLGENDAMKNYSSGQAPSISRYRSKNVFFTDAEIFSYRSLAKAIFWSKHANHREDNTIPEVRRINHTVEM